MRKVKGLIAVMTAVMAISNTMPALAGTWIKDESKNTWMYQCDDGSYLKGCWNWIDGNKDGWAEPYLFDKDGKLYTNCITPDEFQVDSNGAGMLFGEVQRKRFPIEKPSANDVPLAKYRKGWEEITATWDKTPSRWLSNLTKPVRFEDVLVGIYPKERLYPDQIFYYYMIRDFLNSFDWENASNYEKVTKLGEYFKDTRYDRTGDVDDLFYEKRGCCSAYTQTAQHLSNAMGLPFVVFPMAEQAHVLAFVMIEDYEDDSKDIWVPIENGTVSYNQRYTRESFAKWKGYDWFGQQFYDKLTGKAPKIGDDDWNFLLLKHKTNK